MGTLQTEFNQTSREDASKQIHTSLSFYLDLAETLDPELGTIPVKVPEMPGVNEDMRDWSFFMLLEHNAIVNRSITVIVERLVRGEKIEGLADQKTGVMPSENPGPEQVDAFRASVEAHLETIAGLGALRESTTYPHSLFGEFNAHCWHCMFGFHLRIHQPQAAYIVHRFANTT